MSAANCLSSFFELAPVDGVDLFRPAIRWFVCIIVVVGITGFACRVCFDFEECFRRCGDTAVVDCLFARRKVEGVKIRDNCKFRLFCGVVCGDVVDVAGDVGFADLVHDEVDRLFLRVNPAQFHHRLEDGLEFVVCPTVALSW